MNWHDKSKSQRTGPRTMNGVFTELRSIDLRVLPNFRKAMWFGLIALAALITGDQLGGIHAATAGHRFGAYGCAALVAICGVLSSQAAAQEAQRVANHRAGNKAGTPLRIMILLVGYMIAVIAFCDLMDVDLGHLLIGGAITGIVVGLAAQPVLGNLFAGLVLLFARPYVAGEHVRVLSGAINGPHEGAVVSAGLLYTTLQTDHGPLNIPNSTLLAAAVGAAPPTDQINTSSDTPPAASDGTGQQEQSHDLATAVAEGEAIAGNTGNTGNEGQKQQQPGAGAGEAGRADEASGAGH